MIAATIVLCVVLAALAAFQAALIAGAPWGEFAWGGADRVLPPAKKRGSAVAIALYLVFAVVFLFKAHLIPGVRPDGIIGVVTWMIVAYLVLGVLMNAISKSSKERWTMTPLSVLIAAMATIVALG
jgi:hypothetical protein